MTLQEIRTLDAVLGMLDRAEAHSADGAPLKAAPLLAAARVQLKALIDGIGAGAVQGRNDNRPVLTMEDHCRLTAETAEYVREILPARAFKEAV